MPTNFGDRSGVEQTKGGTASGDGVVEQYGGINAGPRGAAHAQLQQPAGSPTLSELGHSVS